MKVPTYQRKVGLEVPKTQAPRMPQVTIPRTVPAAFGADVARATQALGEVGLKIAGHLQQMAIDKQDREEKRKENDFMQDWQNRLTNQEEETVQINGQDITRPKGLLLRQLDQAEGVTLDANSAYQEMRGQYLEGLSQYQVDKLEPFIDRHFLTIQGRVVTHEANQLDANDKQATESNLALRNQEASLIRDPEQLSAAIDDAVTSASTYNSKFDPATQKILNQEIAKNMAGSAIISTIERTGNYGMARTMLDSIKTKIPDSVYNTINDEIAERAINIAISEDMSLSQEDSEVMTELKKGEKGRFSFLSTTDRIAAIKESQERINRNKKVAKLNLADTFNTSELDFANKIINGETTVNDVNQAELLGDIGAEGGISKEFATIARRAVTSAATVNPETVADSFVKLQDQFVDLSIKVYTHKKQKKAKITDRDVDIDAIAKFRQDVMEAWGNGEVTAANAETWLEAVSLVWNDALEKRAKGLNKEAAMQVAEDIKKGKIKDLRNFWGRISFWTDEFAENKAEVKSRLGEELMQRLLGTPQNGDEIVDMLIDKEQNNMNPNKMQYRLNETYNTPLGPAKVIGFDGDGEPLLDNERIRELSK